MLFYVLLRTSMNLDKPNFELLAFGVDECLNGQS